MILPFRLLATIQTILFYLCACSGGVSYKSPNQSQAIQNVPNLNTFSSSNQSSPSPSSSSVGPSRNSPKPSNLAKVTDSGGVNLSQNLEVLSQRFEANSTLFDGIPVNHMGGCGVFEENMDTPFYVALNVFNTPGNYQSEPSKRPIKDPKIMGTYAEGLNCGRWIQVTVGSACPGSSGDAPNQDYCKSGRWVDDEYSGALLNVIVLDSCGDVNNWCRDDTYHLDIHRVAIGSLYKNGKKLPDPVPLGKWNNRKISWNFIKAPNYSGDIRIGFIRDSDAINYNGLSITHLENGIHGIEAKVQGAWKRLKMQGQNGQIYELPKEADLPYQIRVIDASDKYVKDGKVYRFSFPKNKCNPKCKAGFTDAILE